MLHSKKTDSNLTEHSRQIPVVLFLSLFYKTELLFMDILRNSTSLQLNPWLQPSLEVLFRRLFREGIVSEVGLRQNSRRIKVCEGRGAAGVQVCDIVRSATGQEKNSWNDSKC